MMNTVTGLVLLVVAGIGAWSFAAASGARTEAATTTVPAPSLITAEVEERPLTESFTVRGSVESGGSIPVYGPDVGDVEAVVTALPLGVGDPVEAGTVVVAVSDRPVIVLPGTVPMYRPLGRGDDGPDVKRLQQALSSLGLYDGSVDGRFGPVTERAVRRLYEDAGYPAPSAVSEPGQAEPTGVASSGTGTTRIPLGEMVFLPELPTRVATVDVAVGDTVSVDDRLVGLGDGVWSITAEVPVDRAELITVGSAAEVFSEVHQVGARAVVRRVGEEIRTNDRGVRVRDVVLEPEERLPPELAGADVGVTLTVSVSDGPVTVVPVTAIRAEPGGRVFVRRVTGGGDTDDVEIVPGNALGGFVEVRRSDLVPGDLVVVGVER